MPLIPRAALAGLLALASPFCAAQALWLCGLSEDAVRLVCVADADPTLPAMGMRLRLGSGFDLNTLTGQARVIAAAMQRYGLIVHDNGSNWFFQGAPDPGWIDDDLNQLKAIPGTAFEVVDTGPVQTG